MQVDPVGGDWVRSTRWTFAYMPIMSRRSSSLVRIRKPMHPLYSQIVVEDVIRRKVGLGGDPLPLT